MTNTSAVALGRVKTYDVAIVQAGQLHNTWFTVTEVSGGTAWLPNAPAAGATATTYSGAGHRPVGIEMRIIVTGATVSTTDVSQFFRLIIVLDKENNKAVPATTDVLTTGAPTPAGQLIDAVFNVANAGRFKVLYDTVHDLSLNVAAGIAIERRKVIHLVLPLVRHCPVIRAVDPAAGVGSLRKCGIFGFGIFDISGTLSANPSLTGYSRYFFKDLV